jgi:hypothetical protein
MKVVISILLIAILIWFAKFLQREYGAAQPQNERSQQAPPPRSSATALPGMPISLESSLENARKQGADGLAAFLRQYRHAIRDPRLAEIELDYLTLLSLKNPAEARQVFKSVQERTPPSSPLHERIKRLEKNYQ